MTLLQAVGQFLGGRRHKEDKDRSRQDPFDGSCPLDIYFHDSILSAFQGFPYLFLGYTVVIVINLRPLQELSPSYSLMEFVLRKEMVVYTVSLSRPFRSSSSSHNVMER